MTHELERVLGRGRALDAAGTTSALGFAQSRYSSATSESYEAMFSPFRLLLATRFGDGFDEWRVGEMWKLYEGVNYLREVQDAWWIMWRRIAGGLDADAHARIWLI